MYQVVRAPKEGGSVYSIAPVDDLGKVKQVHRSLLKGRTQKDFSVPAPTHSPVVESESPGSGQDSEGLEQGDLWVLVPENPPAIDVAVPVDPGFFGPISGLGAPANSVQPLESEVVPLSEGLCNGDSVPRRSRRATAGQHSNVHHLPRSAGVVGSDGGPSEGTSRTIAALFRPWN